MAHDIADDINEQFVIRGFVIVRGVLTSSEIETYIARLEALAGGQPRWTQADGVNRNPEFWPVIFNERLVATVRRLLGPDVRYLPHNDLPLGFSSFSWHRDNVNRDPGTGPDWDESKEPYRIARVGVYLQRFAESGFRLGFVTGSHRPAELSATAARAVPRRTLAVANVLSGLSGVNLMGNAAQWVEPDAGDAVIFDPRILHTGSRFHGSKYSVFVAYGIENAHLRNHWHYYVRLRSVLGYSKIPAELTSRLRAAGLAADEPRADIAIDGAWIRSATYAYLARRFK